MIRRILFLLFTSLLMGCATSGYQKFYNPFIDAKQTPDVELLNNDAEPKIYGTNNFEEDINILRSKHFLCVGVSSFNGPYDGEKSVISQARRVGATVVLISSKYTNTLTTTSPLFIPNTTTSSHSGTISGGGVVGGYSGTSTTYGSTMVPITTIRQDMIKRPIFSSNQPRNLNLV